jgi:hypothetical protein
LLRDNSTITLVTKKEIVNSGYVYNTYSHEIVVITTWKLVPDKIFSEVTNTDSIQNFDLASLESNSKIVIIGRNRLARSTLIQNILEKFGNEFVENSLAISQNIDTDPVYTTNLPIPTALSLNERYLEQDHKCVILDKCLPSKFPPYVFLMTISLFTDNKLAIVADEYPHYDIMALPTDYYFVFKDDLFTTQKKLYTLLDSIFPSFTTCKECFAQLTDEFDCLVIKKYGKSSNIYNNVFYFKASNY